MLCGPNGLDPGLLSELIHGGLTRLVLDAGWEKPSFPPPSPGDKHGSSWWESGCPQEPQLCVKYEVLVPLHCFYRVLQCLG